MVRAVIQAHDRRAPVKLVTASRGKVLRAEPVAALYASGDVFHAGRFPDLEDQMFAMTRAGYMGDRSPDRVDALVWALTDLMLAGAHGERIKVGFG
jgi:phage terminase large subunit-like protein